MDAAADEAVFKLISSTKSKAAARRMVRYVARVRKKDRNDPTVGAVQLRDGEGEVLTRALADEGFEETRARVDAAFEELELVPEGENLKAGSTPPEDGAPPPAEDLRHRQTYHFSFSTPMREPGDLLLFEEATAAAVRENFTDARHKCLWAVHGADVAAEGESVHGHAHAHLVVKAGHDGGRRRLDLSRKAGGDVRDLRESFAEHARAAGLTAAATWREDRAEVREGVAAGEAVLRPHRDHRRSRLGRRAPEWALAYEPRAVTRWAEARKRRDAGEPAWPQAPRPPEGLERLAPRRRRQRRRRPGRAQERLEGRLEGFYEDVPAAVESWRELRAELEARRDDPSYADWMIANRPEMFGDPLARAFRENGRGALTGDGEFRRLLAGAAAEMPGEPPPRAEGERGAQRRQRKADLDERLAGASALERRRADLREISTSLSSLASELVRDDAAAAPAAERIRAEASQARLRADEAPAPVSPAGRPAPEGGPDHTRRPLRDRGRGE